MFMTSLLIVEIDEDKQPAYDKQLLDLMNQHGAAVAIVSCRHPSDEFKRGSVAVSILDVVTETMNSLDKASKEKKAPH